MSEVTVSLPFLKIASTPLTIEILRLDGEISCLFEFLLFNYINFTPKITQEDSRVNKHRPCLEQQQHQAQLASSSN